LVGCRDGETERERERERREQPPENKIESSPPLLSSSLVSLISLLVPKQAAVEDRAASGSRGEKEIE
jgi:hypothetical protein